MLEVIQADPLPYSSLLQICTSFIYKVFFSVVILSDTIYQFVLKGVKHKSMIINVIFDNTQVSVGDYMFCIGHPLTRLFIKKSYLCQ